MGVSYHVEVDNPQFQNDRRSTRDFSDSRERWSVFDSGGFRNLGFSEIEDNEEESKQANLGAVQLVKLCVGIVVVLGGIAGALYYIADVTTPTIVTTTDPTATPTKSGAPTYSPSPNPTDIPTAGPTDAPTVDKFLYPDVLNNNTLDLVEFLKVGKRRAETQMELSISLEGGVAAATERCARTTRYGYNWIRDQAFLYAEIAHAYKTSELENRDKYEDFMKQYVSYTHSIYALNSGAEEWTLGWAEYQFTGERLESNCTTQNDGPALRSLILIQFAKQFLIFHPNDVDNYITEKLYSPTLLGESNVIKRDLEYLAEYWDVEGCDRWTEAEGKHFYTLVLVQRALKEGAKFAQTRNDASASTKYLAAASAIENELDKFWVSAESTYYPTLGSNYRKNDIQTTMVAVHFPDEESERFGPIDDRTLKTLYESLHTFDELYTINQPSWLGQSNYFQYPKKPLGLGSAVGRYTGDLYAGACNNKDDGEICAGVKCLGQAWTLSINSVAELFYRIAERYLKQKYIEITILNRPLFKYLGMEQIILSTGALRYDEGSFGYNAAIMMLLQAGDAQLRRTQWHARPGVLFNEQINADTGITLSVEEHTTSYTSLLAAHRARQDVNFDYAISTVTPSDGVLLHAVLTNVPTDDYDFTFRLVGELAQVGGNNICLAPTFVVSKAYRDSSDYSVIVKLPKNEITKLQIVGYKAMGSTSLMCAQNGVVEWNPDETSSFDFIKNAKISFESGQSNPPDVWFAKWCEGDRCDAPLVTRPTLEITLTMHQVPAISEYSEMKVIGDHYAIGDWDKCNTAKATYVGEEVIHISDTVKRVFRKWRQVFKIPLPAAKNIMYRLLGNACKDNNWEPGSLNSQIDLSAYAGYNQDSQTLQLNHVWNCNGCSLNEHFVEFAIYDAPTWFKRYILVGQGPFGDFEQPCTTGVPLVLDGHVWRAKFKIPHNDPFEWKVFGIEGNTYPIPGCTHHFEGSGSKDNSRISVPVGGFDFVVEKKWGQKCIIEKDWTHSQC